MSRVVPPPRGMRDFLPKEKSKREAVLSAIRRNFSLFGYEEIETPVMENIERLSSGQGGENEQMIFRVLRRGVNLQDVGSVSELVDLGLRYDLTVPLARFYATNRSKLPSVFRSIQIAPVWRAERPQKGRYRQFTQCDIDVIGEPSLIAEVELITATLSTLTSLGIESCKVRLNDRRILIELLREWKFEEASYGAALITIDKLDKIGVQGVADELAKGNFPGGAIQDLVGFLKRYSDAQDGNFEAVASLLPPSVSRHLLTGLAEVMASVEAAVPSGRVDFDPTLVRGMGYYTGPIFEIDHPSSASSIAGGGRYDGMVGRFLGEDVPACGFSIGFERIVDLVDESRQSPVESIALLWSEEVSSAALSRLQSALVARGKRVNLVRKPKKMARLLDTLAADGYAKFAIVNEGHKSIDDLDLRSLDRKDD